VYGRHTVSKSSPTVSAGSRHVAGKEPHATPDPWREVGIWMVLRSHMLARFGDSEVIRVLTQST